MDLNRVCCLATLLFPKRTWNMTHREMSEDNTRLDLHLARIGVVPFPWDFWHRGHIPRNRRQPSSQNVSSLVHR